MIIFHLQWINLFWGNSSKRFGHKSLLSTPPCSPYPLLCNQGTAIRAIRPKRFSRAARADRPKSRSIRVSLHVEAERNCFKGQVVLRTNYKNSIEFPQLPKPLKSLFATWFVLTICLPLAAYKTTGSSIFFLTYSLEFARFFNADQATRVPIFFNLGPWMSCSKLLLWNLSSPNVDNLLLTGKRNGIQISTLRR